MRRFRRDLDKAIAKTWWDGRERACYLYIKNNTMKRFPIRIGDKKGGAVSLRLDKAWLLSIKPEYVVWFHTHPVGFDEVGVAATRLSTADRRVLVQSHLNAACVGVPKSWTLGPDEVGTVIRCYKKRR